MASLKCLNRVKKIYQIAYGNVYTKNPDNDVLAQINIELSKIDERILKSKESFLPFNDIYVGRE